MDEENVGFSSGPEESALDSEFGPASFVPSDTLPPETALPAAAPPPAAPVPAKPRVTRAYRVDMSEEERQQALEQARTELDKATAEVEHLRPTLGKVAKAVGINLTAGAAATTKQIEGNVIRKYVNIVAPEKPHPEGSLDSYLQWALRPTIAGMLLSQSDVKDQGSLANLLRETGRLTAEEGTAQQNRAAAETEKLGGGPTVAGAASFAYTAGASAPALLGGPWGRLGLAISSGLQTYGTSIEDFKSKLMAMDPTLTEKEAFDKAFVPAAASAAAAAVLTRAFGGTEGFIEDQILKRGLSQLGIKGLLRETFKAASLEFPEEYLQQMSQGLFEKAYIDPNKSWQDIKDESAMAGLQAFALGGITSGTIGGVAKAGSAASRAIGGAIERSRVRRESDLAFHRSTQQAVEEALSRNAKNEIAKAGGLPAVEGQPAVAGTEVQTETGAAQRPGEGGGGGNVRAQVPPTAPPLSNQDVVQQAINQFYPPPVLKKAVFGGYLWDNPNLPSYKIPGIRPGIMRDVSAATARQLGYSIPEKIPTFEEWNAAGRPATVTPEVSFSPAAPHAGVPPDMARLFPGQNVQQIAAQYQTIPTEALRAYPGGPTKFMHDLGSMARTPEDVAALRNMADQHNAEFKRLTTSGDFDSAMMYAGRQPGEAFEYATGTTLAGGPKFQIFEKMRPGYLPPVPGEAYVAEKAKLEPRASKAVHAQQIQTSQPIDWNSFTFVNKEGNRVLDMSTLRQMIVRGDLRGQPGVGAMLLHLMQPSSKHPINPIKLITTLTPDQVTELARSGVAADTSANRAAAKSPYAGLWIPKSGTNVADIEINGIDNSGQPISQQAFLGVLAHELTHNNIDSKIDFASPELKQRMHDIYNFVLQKAEGTRFARENAMENVRELFAEASNNTELQQWLRTLGYRTGQVETNLKNTVWGQILDIVRLLLDLPAKLTTPGGQSIDTITALDEIMQLSAQLENVQRGEYGPEAAPSPAASPGVPPVLGQAPPPVLGPTPPGMNLSQAQVASGAAEIGRVAENVYKAREQAGTALEGLAYERKGYQTARTDLKTLRDQASVFYRAQGIDPDNFKFPDPRDGVKVGPDGQVTVDNAFTGALNAANVPHETARVQTQQAEVWFEGAAHRYNNLSRAIETLQDAAIFYGQHLPDPTEKVAELNKQIAALNKARNKLAGATMADGRTVIGRADEITAADNARQEQLGQRDALSLEPVMEFFGKSVAGYRQTMQKVQSGLAFVQAAAQSETNPAAAQAALAEADKWMNIPQDVKNSILSGKPLSDDQMSAIHSALAQSFEEFDYAFARMRDMAASQIPKINTQIRDTLQKVADAKVNKNASEELLAGVMGTVSPDLRPLKERASAVGSFARFMGDTLDDNENLYLWLLDPSAGPRPLIPPNATMGTDPLTLDMILTEASRNPDFAAALVTLIDANHFKLTEIPMTAFAQIESLLKNPSQENLAEAESLGRWLYRNARGRASLASESMKANLKLLDNLEIERRAQQEGQAMFQQLASSPDFGRMRQAVSTSRWGLVEPMIEQNHVATTFKPFGFPGLPSHPGFVMDTSVDPFFQAEWMKKKLAYEKAAADYVNAYDTAQGMHEKNPQENPSPQQLGFDIPKVRGLRDAVERSIPGAFLDISLGSESRRWKVPDLARKLSKSGWFRQHDFVAKIVGGQTGLDLRNKVGDFINHYLIAQGIRDDFRQLPLIRHAALKSHPEFQMNLANYKEFYNEMAHRGRQFGSDLKVGLKLPRSGIRVTKEDMALLTKERELSEQLRRRVTESNPTQGIRVKTPTRTLVRPGASVGDQGLPRFPGKRADMFVGEATGAYNIEPPPGSPKGTPPTVRSFAPEPGTPPVNLGESSTNPVVAFWNTNMDLVVQHILDVNRQDRAMQITPGMKQAEQELAGQWENFGVEKPKSLEELVQKLTDLYPPAYQTGIDPRDAVIKGLDGELRQFRDAAQRSLTRREEQAQARSAQPEIGFSADNEFTKPAALLELPSPLYDYGPLTDGEHMAFVSRANHERIIAYATAINRAIVDLQNRIDRANHPDPGQRLSAEKAAEAYGGNMAEMEDTLTILKRIQKDFKDAYSVGSFSGKPSGLFNDTMGLLTSGILAMPTVGLRNMTQGQMAVYAMNRAMGNAGHIMTGVNALRNMANTLVRFGVHFADGMVKRSEFWAHKLSGTENKEVFSNMMRQLGNFLTRDDFRATAEQVRKIGLDSREGLLDRMARIWQQTGEFISPQEMEQAMSSKFGMVPQGVPLLGGRKTKALFGVPFRWTKALFDKIGVNQYDFAINTSSLWNAEFLARRIKEVAKVYGQARENLGPFDAGNPEFQLRPNEWSTAYKAHAEDSLNTIRNVLEASVGPLGFQLERSMWNWYQRQKTDPKAPLFTTEQMDALQRRLLMDFNAATPVNRPSAAGANNVVRTLLTLQGYPSDLMLKLVNSGFSKSRDRGAWVNATMKAPVLAAMAIMSIILGYSTSAVTGTWEKYMKGRIPSLATPFDADFWTNFKRWAEGSVALGAAQWGYIGDLVLLMMNEVRGNRGFDPTGRILAASLMERAYKAARGLIDTSFRGAGNFRQGLVPLLDVARTQLPFVPELEKTLWYALGAVKQGERLIRGEAITQGVVQGKRGFGGTDYGPTTVVRRELGEYVSRAYDAAQAGNQTEAAQWYAKAKERMQQLYDYHYSQYIANGKSSADAATFAKRDVANDYADLNPAVAALMGKRPSQAQLDLIMGGITGDRRAMVDRGMNAWKAGSLALLNKTGVTTREQAEAARGGGGGFGPIPGMPRMAGLPSLGRLGLSFNSSTRGAALPSVGTNIPGVRRVRSSVRRQSPLIRVGHGPRGIRTSATVRSIVRSGTRRRAAPKVGGSTTVRGLGTRRRREYAAGY